MSSEIVEYENQIEVASNTLHATFLALRKYRQENEERSALEQVAASDELQAQLRRVEDLQFALDQAKSSTQSLKHQLANETEQRKRAGEVVLQLRGAIEEELWRIAGALHEKQNLEAAHKLLVAEHAQITESVSSTTASFLELQAQHKKLESIVAATALSQGEEFFSRKCSSRVFTNILTFCGPRTALALASTSRVLLGRVDACTPGRLRGAAVLTTAAAAISSAAISAASSSSSSTTTTASNNNKKASATSRNSNNSRYTNTNTDGDQDFLGENADESSELYNDLDADEDGVHPATSVTTSTAATAAISAAAANHAVVAAKDSFVRAIAAMQSSLPQSLAMHWSPHLGAGTGKTAVATTTAGGEDTNEGAGQFTLDGNIVNYTVESSSSVMNTLLDGGGNIATQPPLPPTATSSSSSIIASSVFGRGRTGSIGSPAGGIFGFGQGSKKLQQQQLQAPGAEGGNLVAGGALGADTGTRAKNKEVAAPVTPARGNGIMNTSSGSGSTGSGGSSSSTPSMVASLLSPGSFLSPSKDTSGSNSNSTSANTAADKAAAAAADKIDFKKVGELMNKLKAANANMVNAKRIIDDLTIKLTTAENVKKFLADKVKETEEARMRAIADKDAALFEKNQNVEVMMFLDEKVLEMETKLQEEQALCRKFEEDTIAARVVANSATAKITQIEATKTEVEAELESCKERYRMLEEKQGTIQEQNRQLLERAAMLEQLAMNPEYQLGGGGGGAGNGGKGGETDRKHDDSVSSSSANPLSKTKSSTTKQQQDDLLALKTQYEQRITDLTSQVTAAKEDAKKARATAAAFGGNSLEMNTSTTSPSWSSDKGEISQLKSDLARIKKDLGDSRIASQVLNADLVEAKQALIKAKAETETLKKEIATLKQQQVKNVVDTSSSSSSSSAATSSNSKWLEEQIATLQESLKKAEEEASTARVARDEAQKAAEQATQDIASATAALQEERNKNAKVKSGATTSSSDESVIAPGAGEQGTLIAALQAQLAEQEATWKFQRVTLAKEIKKLRAEKEELLAKLG